LGAQANACHRHSARQVPVEVLLPTKYAKNKGKRGQSTAREVDAAFYSAFDSRLKAETETETETETQSKCMKRLNCGI